jgi:hypothetical protein
MYTCRHAHVHTHTHTHAHIVHVYSYIYAVYIMKKVTVIKQDLGLNFKVFATVTRMEDNKGIKLHQNTIKDIFILVYVLTTFPSIFMF